MKKTILSILLVAIVGFGFASTEGTEETKNTKEAAVTTSVNGTVVDMNTGEALTGVEISIEGTDIKTYSDFDGNFTFSNLNQGEYNIVASYISYNKSLVENYKTSSDNNVNIKLQAD